MNPGAGHPAVSAAAARSTGDLASAALNGMREALRARVAVVQLEGRIAARNLLLAALFGAGAVLALLAGWLALQVAVVLALVASGVLSMLGATIVVATRQWLSSPMCWSTCHNGTGATRDYR